MQRWPSIADDTWLVVTRKVVGVHQLPKDRSLSQIDLKDPALISQRHERPAAIGMWIDVAGRICEKVDNLPRIGTPEHGLILSILQPDDPGTAKLPATAQLSNTKIWPSGRSLGLC